MNTCNTMCIGAKLYKDSHLFDVSAVSLFALK